MVKSQNVNELERAFLDSENERISTKNGSDSPLANYTDFILRSNNYYRNILYKMRDEGKAIMLKEELDEFIKNDKKPRHEFCGLNMKFKSEFIELAKTEFDTLAFRGLSECGLVWRCPICSMKIMQGRQQQLYDYITEHNKTNREVGFVTLTIPHKKKDSLEDTLKKLNTNYNKLQNTRWFIKQRVKFIGQVKALEITYGNINGWHPHLHILYFYNDVTKDEISEFQKELIDRWVVFRDNNAKRIGQDEKIAYDNDIAEYMGKWDVVKEVTAEIIKKSSGVTPFQMLKKVALKDYKNPNQRHFYRCMFREYVAVTKGKHRLAISPKLSKEYPQVKNKTDEELLKDVKIEEILLKIQYIIWLQIARKKLQPHVINSYLKSGFDGIASLLELYNIDFDVVINSDNVPIIS